MDGWMEDVEVERGKMEGERKERGDDEGEFVVTG